MIRIWPGRWRFLATPWPPASSCHWSSASGSIPMRPIRCAPPSARGAGSDDSDRPPAARSQVIRNPQYPGRVVFPGPIALDSEFAAAALSSFVSGGDGRHHDLYPGFDSSLAQRLAFRMAKWPKPGLRRISWHVRPLLFSPSRSSPTPWVMAGWPTFWATPCSPAPIWR